MAVVVITGCSSGFGLASALSFARNGYRVYATIRNPAKTAEVKAAAAAAGVSLTVTQLDVTNDISVERAVAEILQAEGRIDALVNNAGIARCGPVEFLPDAMLRDIFETNFFGPVRVLRAVLPSMRERRSGTIINVSSVAGRLWGKPITWAYDASKHALGVLSDGLALELERFGIRVRVIEPGFFATKMLQNSVLVSRDGSPYSRIEDAVANFFERTAANAPGAGVVAEAIVGAAQDENPWPVHTPVGNDADMLVARLGVLNEQEWASTLKESLGL
jgi:NAD(P)-dependent dehydrogenase (short-subunit alcohol dehydrogenase family)